MTRALIVDDNRALAENIGEILELEGYDVLVYSDSEQAASDVDALRFDVALIDVRMPVLDGVALQHRLCKVHACAHYILMTAYSDDARLNAASAQGIEHVLIKPVLVHDLLQALRTLTSTTEDGRGSPGARG